MLKGIHLTLMMGPVIAVPVPQTVLDALTSVEVTVQDGEPAVFQMTFTLGTRSPLHTLFLLSGGDLQPFLRVILVVTLNGTPNVIMDGFVTHHEISPAADAGHATLTLTGEDLTSAMNLVDFSGFPFPAAPAEGRVALILLKYAFLGIVPLILPSVFVDVPIPTNLIPAETGTDLDYINELAEDVGYVFYIEPGPVPGSNVAYWGPQFRIGVPQPALNMNMDAHRNVESLSFTFDSQSNGIPTVFIHNEITGLILTIPIPDITPLSPPLGLIPPIPTSLKPIYGLSKVSIPRAISVGLAKAAEMAKAVKGKGTLDVVRYGRPLKARQLVGVRGVGTAYDGLHYVNKVTHRIKRGEYKQDFSLLRNGLISTIPRVIP